MTETDSGLLARYRRDNSEDAFAEIVRRHLNLVFSVALRQVRLPQLAQEITQSAFTELARQAHRLEPDTILAAWLYKVAHRTALNVLRGEVRRQVREQIASEMNAINTPDAGWTQVAPFLEEAMQALDETDRAAVLLRYFENKSLREVGQSLGTSDDAAQKRVSRAVERLREYFSKRGVTVGASGLAAVLSANAVQAAPFGLAATISAAALLGASAASVSTAATTAFAMATTQKALFSSLIIAGLATPFAIQYHAQIKLREENQALRQEVDRLAQLAAPNERVSLTRSLAQRLPAPQGQVAVLPAAMPAENVRPTNLITRLLRSQPGDDQPRLTAAQVDHFLNENGRSAATLLSAFRATGDQRLLEEALQKYSQDPGVNFTALFRSWFHHPDSTAVTKDSEASPAERREWLEALKASAPRNALANYLSALEYFRSGQADQAVRELNVASAKPLFQDYSADFVQNDEEAWRTAGYSVAEAKTAASMSLVLPHFGAVKELSQDILSLAESYRREGNEAAAEAALQAALGLGQRLDGSPGQSLVSQLVGAAVQAMALRKMDPAARYADGDQTAQERLDELARQRAAIRELTSQFEAVQPRVSDQDWISYKDRWRSFGEEAALRWLVSKYNQK